MSKKMGISKASFLNLFLALIGLACGKSTDNKSYNGHAEFPDEIVDFVPYQENPVFTGTGINTWDEAIRERGYIIREEDGYHLWYTGYRKNKNDETKYLGYATSPDGFVWDRHSNNPIFKKNWVEDMMVVKVDSIYYMFAEGRNDIAHMLTSTDKIRWDDHGALQIQYTNGKPLAPGPYGTPTVWIENGTWYLFYERNDEGIWLATSKDLKRWINVRDEPVLEKGPEGYDKFGVALNQIIKYRGNYYAYYHGTPLEDWSDWNTNVALSKNLIDWVKYDRNPIMKENKSSGILVHDGSRFRLYTMHPDVCVHFPVGSDDVSTTN